MTTPRAARHRARALGSPVSRLVARRARLVALLLLVAILGACGAGGHGPPHATRRPAAFQPRARDFAEVRALLARRAHAVLHHDRAAFLATVDPRSPSLLRRQAVLFANLGQLSVASLRYVMDPSVELVPATVAGTDPVFRPQVYEYLRITGTLQHPVSNALQETFVRRGGRWLLGAETTPGNNDSFDSAQERPWFGVPIVGRRVGPMTVLVDRSRAASLGPLLAAVHDDIVFDAARLGVRPSYRILVDATSNGSATSFNSFSREQAAAVTFPLDEADPKDPTSFKALAGHAIKINPRQAATYAADPGILRHELTHFLLHRFTGTNPKWLVEGVATWMQYYPDDFAGLSVSGTLYHRLMTAPRALPVLGLFDDDPDVSYPVSQAAVAWLVGRAGMPRLLELMRAYSAHAAGVNADALTPRMLRLVYGVSQGQVVRGAFALLATLQH